MESIVLIHKDLAVVTSMQVAEKFGKRHDHVLRAIKSILGGLPKNEHTPQMFIKGYRVDEQNGQRYPIYYMNRDGFSLLAMGFTGKKALQWKLKYIEAFNKMEEYIKQSVASKVSQKDAMAVLKDANAAGVDYIKVNTIANKAVSNMFGHPKSIKKAEMSKEELAKRDEVIAETAKLMALRNEYDLDFSVKDKIYEKYS